MTCGSSSGKRETPSRRSTSRWFSAHAPTWTLTSPGAGRRLRQVLDAQLVDPAELVEPDCPHGALPGVACGRVSLRSDDCEVKSARGRPAPARRRGYASGPACARTAVFRSCSSCSTGWVARRRWSVRARRGSTRSPRAGPAARCVVLDEGDLARFAVLGYQPAELPGRAVLEARGHRLAVDPESVYAIATLRPSVMRDGARWVVGHAEPRQAALAARTFDLLDRLDADVRVVPVGLGRAVVAFAGLSSDRLADDGPGGRRPAGGGAAAAARAARGGGRAAGRRLEPRRAAAAAAAPPERAHAALVRAAAPAAAVRRAPRPARAAGQRHAGLPGRRGDRRARAGRRPPDARSRRRPAPAAGRRGPRARRRRGPGGLPLRRRAGGGRRRRRAEPCATPCAPSTAASRGWSGRRSTRRWSAWSAARCSRCRTGRGRRWSSARAGLARDEVTRFGPSAARQGRLGSVGAADPRAPAGGVPRTRRANVRPKT